MAVIVANSEDQPLQPEAELRKYELLRNARLETVKALEVKPRYMIKEWTRGSTGDVWKKYWESDGSSRGDPYLIRLRQLVEHAVRNGIYIEGLRLPSLLATPQYTWTISHIGELRSGLSPLEARALYEKQLPSAMFSPSSGDPCDVPGVIRSTLGGPSR